MPKNIAIILASGTGTRFKSETPKQFLKLAGKMVIEHTLDMFENHPLVDEIIVVVDVSNRLFTENLIIKNNYKKINKIINGGTTRQESSAAGVAAIEDDESNVLVHDAARPLISASIIERCINGLKTHQAIDTAIPSPDTVIFLDDQECIASIPDRSRLRLGQTPQAFKSGILKQAHQLAKNNPNLSVTDDCGLVMHFNLAKIFVVEGDVSNIKITYPSDIYLADRLFQLRSVKSDQDPKILKNLTGKVIVIFGSGRGIGKSIAQIAQEHGAHVVGASRSTGVDITNQKSVKKTLEYAKHRYGKIDAVINTAGVLRTGLLAGQSQKIIEKMIAVNLQGSIIVAQESFEFMKETGGKILLYTSSSYTRGRALSAVYSATKAAIVNLTQGLAEEYLDCGVYVNAINPERTATPMRVENFGNEPAESLLDVKRVAEQSLMVILSNLNGEIVDVRI